MAQVADTEGTTDRALPAPPMFSTPAEAAVLRDVLKRCSPATYEAACRFRRTGDVAHLPAIVRGLIERYVDPDRRAKLQDPDDALRLSEDLGLDSLTLLEFVMFAEDVLEISIDNDELGRVRTLGDFRRFLEGKLLGLSPSPAAQWLLADSG